MKQFGSGWGSGLLGVIIFSGSLPATRVAVGGFSPLFLTSARAVVAGCLAALALFVFSRHRPTPAEIGRLAIVAGGVVLGFPLLTALALRQMTSAHSIVFIGLLPLATALFGVLRGGERPRAPFWIFSIVGALSVAGFALLQSGEATGLGNALMLAAILVCGLGYAEGAVLARRLGGWQVISWALLVALPAMTLLSLATRPETFGDVPASAWAGLGYVSVFSMLIGFVFWYRGLALGGIAGVGQLQLLQPFFGLALAGLLLGEPIAWSMIASTILVVACVAGARRYA